MLWSHSSVSTGGPPADVVVVDGVVEVVEDVDEVDTVDLLVDVEAGAARVVCGDDDVTDSTGEATPSPT